MSYSPKTLDYNEDSGFSSDSYNEDFQMNQLDMNEEMNSSNLRISLFSSPVQTQVKDSTCQTSLFSDDDHHGFESILSSCPSSSPPKLRGIKRTLFGSESSSPKRKVTSQNRIILNGAPGRDRPFGSLKRQTSEPMKEVISCKKGKGQVVGRPDGHLQRHSSEVLVKSSMDSMSCTSGLTGDFSKKMRLPIESKNGKNNDLNSISHQTMSDLLNGIHEQTVSNYIVVDCRYPYEFEAGHIKNAVNWYTKEMIMENLMNLSTQMSDIVLIFHCEFSSERGPKMARFLRNMDRDNNRENYPSLRFPEIYLLKDGYKEFFHYNKDSCQPSCYLPMLHPEYKDQLRKFRSQRKQEKRANKRFLNYRLH